MQRHHGALREADQRQTRIVKPGALKLRIEEGVEDRGGPAHTLDHGLRGPILKTEPLEAHRRHVAWLRRVRGNKRGTRENLGQLRRKREQIVAVGPKTVQQNDERRARLAGCRKHPRPIDQGSVHVHQLVSILFDRGHSYAKGLGYTRGHVQ